MEAFNLEYTTQSNFLLGIFSFKNCSYICLEVKAVYLSQGCDEVKLPIQNPSTTLLKMCWVDDLVKLPFNLCGLINIFFMISHRYSFFKLCLANRRYLILYAIYIVTLIDVFITELWVYYEGFICILWSSWVEVIKSQLAYMEGYASYLHKFRRRTSEPFKKQ